MFFNKYNTLYLFNHSIEQVTDIIKSNDKLCPFLRSEIVRAPFIFPKIEYNPKSFIIYAFEPNTNPNKTIIIVNIENGWPFLEPLFNEYNHFYFLKVRYSAPKEKYHIYEFIHFKNGKERLIRSMYDPKWVFYESGEVQSFENTSYYSNKVVKDRMNLNILIEYLLKEGWKLDEDLFQTNKEWQIINYR
jgi:hypothetical protein